MAISYEELISVFQIIRRTLDRSMCRSRSGRHRRGAGVPPDTGRAAAPAATTLALRVPRRPKYSAPLCGEDIALVRPYVNGRRRQGTCSAHGSAAGRPV